jgi:hypothetical protein
MKSGRAADVAPTAQLTQLRHARHGISAPPRSFIGIGLQSLEGCGLVPRLADSTIAPLTAPAVA